MRRHTGPEPEALPPPPPSGRVLLHVRWHPTVRSPTPTPRRRGLPPRRRLMPRPPRSRWRATRFLIACAVTYACLALARGPASSQMASVVVVGSMGSGTAHTTRGLRALGLDVRHEQTGGDGAVGYAHVLLYVDPLADKERDPLCSKNIQRAWHPQLFVDVRAFCGDVQFHRGGLTKAVAACWQTACPAAARRWRGCGAKGTCPLRLASNPVVLVRHPLRTLESFTTGFCGRCSTRWERNESRGTADPGARAHRRHARGSARASVLRVSLRPGLGGVLRRPGDARQAGHGGRRRPGRARRRSVRYCREGRGRYKTGAAAADRRRGDVREQRTSVAGVVAGAQGTVRAGHRCRPFRRRREPTKSGAPAVIVAGPPARRQAARGGDGAPREVLWIRSATRRRPASAALDCVILCKTPKLTYPGVV